MTKTSEEEIDGNRPMFYVFHNTLDRMKIGDIFDFRYGENRGHLEPQLEDAERRVSAAKNVVFRNQYNEQDKTVTVERLS